MQVRFQESSGNANLSQIRSSRRRTIVCWIGLRLCARVNERT
ncbi:hypothetical protein RchiOBHm_Chr5g0026531 [Rosa chinensis]|uniref:Uncharacterized protein n=1 Tax=Rosa chinensis TaxID=74649 RepID=A0A2P6Q8V5_ROSCH|nr:hypothetical protein RchiOBHm_Chr5g0026531 [Rosa chinensis]